MLMKKEKNDGFIKLPSKETSFQVSPQALLMYVYIRSYLKDEKNYCWPSLNSLCLDSGLSINTIKKYTDELERAGYLKVEKEKRKRTYIFFDKKEKFERFDREFLYNRDLSFTEKAYLVASQQYMFKEDGIGKIEYSQKEISEKINMPYPTVVKQNNSLIKKEFASLEQSFNAGNSKLQFRYFLSKLGQKFWEQDKKIQENTEAIQDNANRTDKLEKLLKLKFGITNIDEELEKIEKESKEIIL